MIVEETTAGDPMSPLRWTSKSTRTIAEELSRTGHPISSVTVGRCLEEMGYTLQANVKTREGSQHPNRDAQFRYLNRQVKAFRRAGDPAISVDTKKKELVGAFKNAGRRWLPRGKADRVLVHDFPHLGEGKAIPYGVFPSSRTHKSKVSISGDAPAYRARRVSERACPSAVAGSLLRKAPQRTTHAFTSRVGAADM